MATEITMPKLSDTMTDGRFITWRKNVGDRIERGDVIAEVETDKAVMELEAFATGVLLKTMAKGGETVPVGTVLGLIGGAGELPEEGVAAAVPAAAETTVVEASPTPAPEPPTAARPVLSLLSEHEAGEHGKASPLVRRLAREQGIDLAKLHGSGPEGRILQEDLAATAAQQQPSAMQAAVTMEAPPSRSPVPPAGGLQPPSAMRQAISAAVSRSWREIPHFSVTVEIGMEACREVVSELKGGEKQVGFNALIIKACSVALTGFPLLQARPEGVADGPVNISFAVALPEGLLMPVIRDCRRLSAAEIGRECSRLGDKARNGRLTSEEMSGGSFSVSNLGMYGVDEFTALIMPGQVAILAVGAVSERPVVRGGQLAVAPTMRVTLSSDHRVVDGAYAAAFLAELRRILEHPVALLV
jgi:pyruvate dehydrogenase E2 component (dihydrolipoamide acetyltransferase)